MERTPLQVSNPVLKLSDLDDQIRFYDRKGIKTRVENRLNRRKVETYVLWRAMTPTEECDLAQGILTLVKGSLAFAKDNHKPKKED
jgi:hypothetical protein